MAPLFDRPDVARRRTAPFQSRSMPARSSDPIRSVSEVDSIPASAAEPVSSTRRARLPAWKRAIDLSGCVLALPLLGICTLLMFVLTRAVSPGPVLYWQERVGHRGRRFRIYKFRTMETGADPAVHQQHFAELVRTNTPMVKLDARGDARLIPFAWLLRASGLDELPQIINVLRGEMSLVGPRPCMPAEFEQYVPWQRQRCEAVPGLTGLWQVSGKNRTTFVEMIHLDIRYVRQTSLGLDLKIIALTLPCLIGQVQESRRSRRDESTRSFNAHRRHG